MNNNSTNENSNLKSFLSFERMVSFKIIQFIYIIGNFAIILMSLIFMFRGSFSSFISGLFLLILGSLLWRVFCEGSIILFRINETLTKIEKNTIK